MNVCARNIAGPNLILGALVSITLAGCVTNIAPSTQQNPPPSEPLSGFSHFELMPTDASAEARKEDAALAKIDSNLQVSIKRLILPWEKADPAGRTLKIEPFVKELKFVSGNQRFWGGAFAGSSAVVMTLRLVDATSNAVIAEPEFYQRAAAMSGTWTFGAQDNAMLSRIVEVSAQFLQLNYDKAVGGPTGLEDAGK